MAELWGAVLRGLGIALDAIYGAVPSYGVAIVLLTMAVRALLIPLTIKQIRSMTSMQKIQPELKKLQALHKGDRQKLNEEVMKLYKEHGVNPLGGCLPLLAQTPVFIALYSVLRASILVVPTTVMLIGGPPGESTLNDAYKNAAAAEGVLCRPQSSSATGSSPNELICEDKAGNQKRFQVSGFVNDGQPIEAPWVTLCRPVEVTIEDTDTKTMEMHCGSRFGTGHLPRDGKLFADITADKGTFLGMHLGCSLTQAQSKAKVAECTADPRAGGATAAIPYYILIGLVAATTWYQSKQMASRATGQAAQSQQMLTKIMPVVIAFVSISFPAGVAVYWTTTNAWTIAQQAVILKKQGPMPPEDALPAAPTKGKGSGPSSALKDGKVKSPGKDNNKKKSR